MTKRWQFEGEAATHGVFHPTLPYPRESQLRARFEIWQRSSAQAPLEPMRALRWSYWTPNDEVERRGVAPTSSEAVLSQSSTPSLAHRRRSPRSREPIVRLHLEQTCASQHTRNTTSHKDHAEKRSARFCSRGLSATRGPQYPTEKERLVGVEAARKKD